MPLATLQSLTFVGVRPVAVQIEVHLSAGLPSFALVGLPDTEIRESKERVRSALLNSGFEFPLSTNYSQPRAGRPSQGQRGIRSCSGIGHCQCVGSIGQSRSF